MNYNPFEQIDSRLSNIETLLLSIKQNTPDQAPEAPDKLLTIDEASIFLRLAKPTIYSMCSRGKIPYMKRAKKLYFSKDELMIYLKAGRVRTNTEIEADALSKVSFKRKGGTK